ncbi:uncharacterized protein F5891DRAFT_984900 [Suillus fuscotomentosus]|uniref:Uncharacterized protein n=1 Tax=Suillus fuscotomentosus TaxID=1912939 RepID=A0AAD4HFG5_9AGAM|nr:uncharacterized protein F5891DRAFT_984900 [Suillus fuscotomentosus]KAG1894628.1 hypothetical protein F5891DRAFT_984900 [Suillus fuscotomentosus]
MCLSAELFDHSTARASIFPLSNILGSEFLDAYIGLIANQKLQTELYVLSFLLKERVYPGDLWEIIGERSIEAKQEEMLRRYQSVCTNEDSGKHTAVERILLEERRKRCQMEVSLYTQAIEVLEQHWLSRLGARSKHAIRPPSRQTVAPTDYAPLPCTPLACSIAARGRCEIWLMKNDARLIPTATSLMEALSPLHHSISSCIGPSLPLSSTWVTADVQEAFYQSFKQELTMQAELMVTSLATRRSNAYLRNLGLDLLILQAKRRRAHAEIALYTMAIDNLHGYNLSNTSSSTSSNPNILRPLCKETHYYNEDIEDGTEESCGDYEDYEDYEDCEDLDIKSICWRMCLCSLEADEVAGDHSSRKLPAAVYDQEFIRVLVGCIIPEEHIDFLAKLPDYRHIVWPSALQLNDLKIAPATLGSCPYLFATCQNRYLGHRLTFVGQFIFNALAYCFWYQCPFAHCVCLAFEPTATIDLNEGLKAKYMKTRMLQQPQSIPRSFRPVSFYGTTLLGFRFPVEVVLKRLRILYGKNFAEIHGKPNVRAASDSRN